MYPELFRMSLLRSAEIVLKSLIALRKNDVSPINPLISFMDFGAGQFLMTAVFASPGEIPLFIADVVTKIGNSSGPKLAF